MPSLMIRNLQTVVTCDDADSVLSQVDLYCEDGVLRAMGPDLPQTADTVLDGSRCIAYPGLVNTHHHLYQVFSRNLPQVQNLELFDWLTALYEIWKGLDREVIRNIQMVFQDPAASLNERATVDYIVSEGLYNFHLYKNEADRVQKVEKMINEVGLLPEHLTRYPHEFSGGQRQRIGLARAMIMEPELVVADEPISALDVSIRAQVLNLLKKFQREQGTTYLFIAHDLSIVRFISDRIGVIYKGDIVEVAEAEELFNYPMHPYTKSLISAIPIPDPKLEKNKELFTYDPSIHDYSEDKPEMVDIGNNHFVYGNKKEIEEYKALRAKNVPIKSITIRDENEPPKQTPKKEASPEEIHMAPARDTGSFWYNFLGFLLPLLSLLGAHIFRTHNYIRNYKALKKGAIVGLVFRAVLIGIFALLLVLAVI